eukprot:m51a1_g1971 hypothetical protein (2243) ;mRNA; r:1089871-1097869
MNPSAACPSGAPLSQPEAAALASLPSLRTLCAPPTSQDSAAAARRLSALAQLADDICAASASADSDARVSLLLEKRVLPVCAASAASTTTTASMVSPPPASVRRAALDCLASALASPALGQRTAAWMATPACPLAPSDVCAAVCLAAPAGLTAACAPEALVPVACVALPACRAVLESSASAPSHIVDAVRCARCASPVMPPDALADVADLAVACVLDAACLPLAHARSACSALAGLDAACWLRAPEFASELLARLCADACGACGARAEPAGRLAMAACAVVCSTAPCALPESAGCAVSLCRALSAVTAQAAADPDWTGVVIPSVLSSLCTAVRSREAACSVLSLAAAVADSCRASASAQSRSVDAALSIVERFSTELTPQDVDQLLSLDGFVAAALFSGSGRAHVAARAVVRSLLSFPAAALLGHELQRRATERPDLLAPAALEIGACDKRVVVSAALASPACSDALRVACLRSGVCDSADVLALLRSRCHSVRSDALRSLARVPAALVDDVVARLLCDDEPSVRREAARALARSLPLCLPLLFCRAFERTFDADAAVALAAKDLCAALSVGEIAEPLKRVYEMMVVCRSPLSYDTADFARLVEGLESGSFSRSADAYRRQMLSCMDEPARATPALLSDVPANFWVLWSAARHCVCAKLKTHLGGPVRTFEHVEKLLAVQGPTAAHILEFVEHLEKFVFAACDSISAGPYTTPGGLFFVCQDWFERLRRSRVRLAVSSANTMSHAARQLQTALADAPAKALASDSAAAELERNLALYAAVSIELRDSDSVAGVLEWARQQQLKAPACAAWFSALELASQGRTEESLNSFMSMPVSDLPADPSALSVVGRVVCGLVRRLGSWDDALTWRARVESAQPGCPASPTPHELAVGRSWSLLCSGSPADRERLAQEGAALQYSCGAEVLRHYQNMQCVNVASALTCDGDATGLQQGVVDNLVACCPRLTDPYVVSRLIRVVEISRQLKPKSAPSPYGVLVGALSLRLAKLARSSGNAQLASQALRRASELSEAIESLRQPCLRERIRQTGGPAGTQSLARVLELAGIPLELAVPDSVNIADLIQATPADSGLSRVASAVHKAALREADATERGRVLRAALRMDPTRAKAWGDLGDWYASQAAGSIKAYRAPAAPEGDDARVVLATLEQRSAVPGLREAVAWQVAAAVERDDSLEYAPREERWKGLDDLFLRCFPGGTPEASADLRRAYNYVCSCAFVAALRMVDSAVLCYCKSLGLRADTSAVAALKIIRALSRHGDYLSEHTLAAIALVPVTAWRPLVPQITSRVFGENAPCAAARRVLTRIACAVASVSPHLLVYPSLAATASHAQAQDSSVLPSFVDRGRDMLQQTSVMIRELSRIAVLPEEQWSSALQQALAAPSGAAVDKVRAMLAELASAPDSTPHEAAFRERYEQQLRKAVDALAQPQSEQQLDGVRDLCRQLARSTRPGVPLHMRDLSPFLASLEASQVPMPVAAASGSCAVVSVRSVDGSVLVLPTYTKPKRVSFVGDDGARYSFLLKGKEDLRLDERVMQFLGVANELLASRKETRGRRLRTRTYCVTPLGGQVGLIQWVEGAVPLFSVFKQWQLSQQQQQGQQLTATAALRPLEAFNTKIVAALKQRHMQGLARAEWPHEAQLAVWEELRAETPAGLLEQALWRSSATCAEMLVKQRVYAVSVAAMSMIGHVVGLGDRHLDNILFDPVTGEVVHIDYNICFDKGLKLRIPEVIPFRLTQNMVRAMGFTGVEGTFRRSCEDVATAMRGASVALLTLLESFVHDPLTDWDSHAAEDDMRKDADLSVALSLLADALDGVPPALSALPPLVKALEAVQSAREACDIARDRLAALETAGTHDSSGLEASRRAAQELLEDLMGVVAPAQAAREADDKMAALSGAFAASCKGFLDSIVNCAELSVLVAQSEALCVADKRQLASKIVRAQEVLAGCRRVALRSREALRHAEAELEASLGGECGGVAALAPMLRDALASAAANDAHVARLVGSADAAKRVSDGILASAAFSPEASTKTALDERERALCEAIAAAKKAHAEFSESSERYAGTLGVIASASDGLVHQKRVHSLACVAMARLKEVSDALGSAGPQTPTAVLAEAVTNIEELSRCMASLRRIAEQSRTATKPRKEQQQPGQQGSAAWDNDGSSSESDDSQNEKEVIPQGCQRQTESSLKARCLYALKMVSGVEAKLRPSVPVKEQVQSAIAAATDPNNLCRLYEGWTSWI